tara:strand:+ start:4161 stop:4424 length:264 start_codon:yes stop_codon:yes gene_type:complete
MKKTTAQYLFDKFEKLETALKAQGESNPEWLNNALLVFNKHIQLDTMKQCSDALHAQYDFAAFGTLRDYMVKANSLWKEVRVHPMFK